MPVQSAPKEVDPGDVALSPDHEICEEIYQRVLTEVRARIDQRIADIEAQAVSLPVEAGDPAEDGEPRGLQQPPRRRPLLRAVVTLVASAGLVGAVVTLARDHRETIHSVTERIDAAVQASRDHSKAIEQLQASQDQLARAFQAAKNDAVGAATPARLPPRPPPPRSPRFP